MNRSRRNSFNAAARFSAVTFLTFLIASGAGPLLELAGPPSPGAPAVAVIATAHADEPPSELEKADRHFQAQEWKQAADAYKKVTRKQPANGMAWFRLGFAHHNLEKYEDARKAYAKAEATGFRPQVVRFNLACTEALTGDPDEAFAWLDRAVEAGFSNVKALNDDEELAGLRDDPRFAEIVTATDKNARPCQYDERYRAMDFWIGNWKVVMPSGVQAGTNSIFAILEGCVVLENWTSRTGSTGKSINYFDPEIGKWRQQWVDAGGSVISYEGELVDGAMHFEGKNVGKDGTEELSRMTLTPLEDGSVRQLIEQSKDGGETWYVWFEGRYVQRQTSANEEAGE